MSRCSLRWWKARPSIWHVTLATSVRRNFLPGKWPNIFPDSTRNRRNPTDGKNCCSIRNRYGYSSNTLHNCHFWHLELMDYWSLSDYKRTHGPAQSGSFSSVQHSATAYSGSIDSATSNAFFAHLPWVRIARHCGSADSHPSKPNAKKNKYTLN